MENSIYDSHTWQARYGDPGFHKHAAAAKMLGLMSKLSPSYMPQTRDWY